MTSFTNPLVISARVAIPLDEIEITAIRASGPGGQNVNKVATAIQLRFDTQHSSLPDSYKTRLMALKDQRITSGGVIVIKAQRYRTQEKNREDALQRLQALLRSVSMVQKKRIATRPTRSSQQKRLNSKSRHGQQKRLRGRVEEGN